MKVWVRKVEIAGIKITKCPDKTEYMEYENKSYFCDDKARLIMQQIVVLKKVILQLR